MTRFFSVTSFQFLRVFSASENHVSVIDLESVDFVWELAAIVLGDQAVIILEDRKSWVTCSW